MTILYGRNLIARENADFLGNNNAQGISNDVYLKEKYFSKAERDLLQRMIDPDITKRLSLEDALDRWKALPPSRRDSY
ncbi:MAG: hypothetical protein AB8G05_21735 [Oligoflexales bacterium]